jgi:hypothetical protein
MTMMGYDRTSVVKSTMIASYSIFPFIESHEFAAPAPARAASLGLPPTFPARIPCPLICTP